MVTNTMAPAREPHILADVALTKRATGMSAVTVHVRLKRWFAARRRAKSARAPPFVNPRQIGRKRHTPRWQVDRSARKMAKAKFKAARSNRPSLIEVPMGAFPSPWKFIHLLHVRGRRHAIGAATNRLDCAKKTTWISLQQQA